jgi:hypothetical protein
MGRLKAPVRRDAGPLFGGRPLAEVLADRDRLRSCYELWFDYVAQEAQGAPPPAGAVGHTLATIRTLEPSLGRAEADQCYAQARAEYRQDTGRCHRSGCGRVLPCDCPDGAAA